jgi:hypothetical protein
MEKHMNHRLNSTAEQKLRSLGNKRYYRTLILTVVWLVLVLAGFLAFMIVSKRSFADFRNYLILLLCLLPFFPFGAHKVLLSKTFYATVSYEVNATRFEGLEWAGTRNRPTKVDVLEITFKRDDGKEIMIAYKKNPYPGKGLHYADGTPVLFVRGLKYPYKCSAAEDTKFTCPACGTTVESDHPVCKGCRLDLTE